MRIKGTWSNLPMHVNKRDVDSLVCLGAITADNAKNLGEFAVLVGQLQAYFSYSFWSDFNAGDSDAMFRNSCDLPGRARIREVQS